MNIIESLLEIQKEVGHIGKDQKNTFQNYNFRGIDDVYNYLHGLFVKHEIITFPKILKSENVMHQSNNKTVFKVYFEVEYAFVAKDGSRETMSIAGEGADSSDKATGKALSNAHKYALFQMFMIPTEENKDSDQSKATDFSGKKDVKSNEMLEKLKLQKECAELIESHTLESNQYMDWKNIITNQLLSFSVDKINEWKSKVEAKINLEIKDKGPARIEAAEDRSLKNKEDVEDLKLPYNLYNSLKG